MLSVADAGTVPLTLNFFTEDSGRHRCRIVLRRSGGAKNQLSAAGDVHGGARNQLTAAGDVRVFQVCCVVLPQGNKATIDFVSPVNTQVVQNIPVVCDADGVLWMMMMMMMMMMMITRQLSSFSLNILCHRLAVSCWCPAEPS